MNGDQPSAWDADRPSEWDTYQPADRNERWATQWEDDDLAQEDELFTAADVAQLAELSVLLSAVPVPALPGPVADRIGASIAAEAATRAAQPQPSPSAAPMGAEAGEVASEAAGTAGTAGGSRVLGKPRPRFGLRRRGGSGERRFQGRPVTAVAALAVCLVLSGVGYGISSVSSSLNSTDAGPGGAPVAGAAQAGGPSAGASSVRAAAPRATTGASPSGTAVGSPTSPAMAGTPNETPTAPQTGGIPASSAAAPTPVTSSSSVSAGGGGGHPLPTASATGIGAGPTPTPSASSSAPVATTFPVVASGTAYSLPTATLVQQMVATEGNTSLTRTQPTAAQQACATEAVAAGRAVGLSGNIPMLLDTGATFGGKSAYVVLLGIPTKPFALSGVVVAPGNCSTLLASAQIVTV